MAFVSPFHAGAGAAASCNTGKVNSIIFILAEKYCELITQENGIPILHDILVSEVVEEDVKKLATIIIGKIKEFAAENLYLTESHMAIIGPVSYDLS